METESSLEITETTVSSETTASTVDSIPEETYEISETLANLPTEISVLEDDPKTIEETVAITTEPVYIDVIQDTGNALIHASLFGSFLVCGTLVGIFLLRGRYGT